MNEKKKMQPKVRFREFTGENASDWEQRKFIDIVERLNKTEDNVKLPRIEFEDIVSGEGRLNKDLNTKKDDRKGIFFDENNILYGKLRPYLRKWYYARFAGVAIGDFWVLKIINNNHPLFIYYLIQTEKYQRVANDTSGTKMPRSDWKKVSESLFYIPNINEQKKISTIFNIIDNLITLHQRKLEQLEQLKNTLLSKMFPKSGTNIPEIRFSGFTDAWKQRKLEEIIVKEIKGKAKSENISTNFANKGSLYLDTEYLNGGKPKYVSLPSDTDENDIIILWDGSQAGKLYKGVVGALGSTLKAYKIPEHTLFYYYQMLGSQEKIYNQYRTPNIPHVVKSFTSEFMIWDTSNDEKTLIIDIYSNLFNYIVIHQRKLDQLKNLKQTLLNKMFI
ncbi:restriction endonuclease subunit S [Enterococcus cecorum]|uniref:restriction endonuclease subunit S n=1 Tax=Enterococcus cecorum TaxID=44008 RepID=UPI0032C472AE